MPKVKTNLPVGWELWESYPTNEGERRWTLVQVKPAPKQVTTLASYDSKPTLLDLKRAIADYKERG